MERAETQPRFSAQECKYATDVAYEDATTGPLVNIVTVNSQRNNVVSRRNPVFLPSVRV